MISDNLTACRELLKDPSTDLGQRGVVRKHMEQLLAAAKRVNAKDQNYLNHRFYCLSRTVGADQLSACRKALEYAGINVGDRSKITKRIQLLEED